MEEKKILEEDLEKVSGGTGQETTQLIEKIRFCRSVVDNIAAHSFDFDHEMALEQ